MAPGILAKMEEESRQWVIKCPKCGYETSVWDAGGIRYKARGYKRTLGKCTSCGKFRWLKIYKAT